MRENQKTIKIGFPSRGKIKNHRKSAFPHGGKQKIIENQLSLTGENKKSSKISFPSRRKTRNHRKSAFPHGGKSKIIENRLSLTGENKKSSKISFPNIGKNKKCHWLHFPTLGKTKNPESLLSDFRGSVLFWYTLFYLLIADLLQSLFNVGNDVIHILNAHREAD